MRSPSLERVPSCPEGPWASALGPLRQFPRRRLLQEEGVLVNMLQAPS